MRETHWGNRLSVEFRDPDRIVERCRCRSTHAVDVRTTVRRRDPKYSLTRHRSLPSRWPSHRHGSTRPTPSAWWRLHSSTESRDPRTSRDSRRAATRLNARRARGWSATDRRSARLARW